MPAEQVTATPPSKVPKPKTAAERKQRVGKILEGLDKLYPNATCALTHRSPWELLVATILSAQCTDVRVNQVTPGLFRKYPTMTDFAHANQKELANDIRSTGFFNNKARSVIGAAKKILTDFKGQIPRDIDDLLQVPGAARKTANVVLGTAFGIASGVVVDTHVHRVSRRLDLTKKDDPVGIEQDLMKIIRKSAGYCFHIRSFITGVTFVSRVNRVVVSACWTRSVTPKIRRYELVSTHVPEQFRRCSRG